jgi:hypothetical protein
VSKNYSDEVRAEPLALAALERPLIAIRKYKSARSMMV